MNSACFRFPNICVLSLGHLAPHSLMLALRERSELLTTLTLLKAMAAPATMGLSMKPHTG